MKTSASWRLLTAAFAFFFVSILAACGGGGGGSDPPPIGPPPITTLFASAPSCVIQVGTPGCEITLNVSWSNLSQGKLVNEAAPNTPLTTVSGVSATFTWKVSLPPGTSTFAIRNGNLTDPMKTVTVTASCVTGSTWNGSTCALPAPPVKVAKQIIGGGPGRPNFTYTRADGTMAPVTVMAEPNAVNCNSFAYSEAKQMLGVTCQKGSANGNTFVYDVTKTPWAQVANFGSKNGTGVATDKDGKYVYVTIYNANSPTGEPALEVYTMDGKLVSTLSLPSGFVPAAITGDGEGGLVDKAAFVAAQSAISGQGHFGVVWKIDLTNPAAPNITWQRTTGTDPNSLSTDIGNGIVCANNGFADHITIVDVASGTWDANTVCLTYTGAYAGFIDNAFFHWTAKFTATGRLLAMNGNDAIYEFVRSGGVLVHRATYTGFGPIAGFTMDRKAHKIYALGAALIEINLNASGQPVGHGLSLSFPGDDSRIFLFGDN